MTEHRILQGDVMDGLRALPDACVQCTITSPPYFALRDYQTGKWEGGDPECQHEGNERYYTEKSAAGSSGEAFSEAGPLNAERIKKARWREKGICTKCGARYVDRQIGLEATPEEFIDTMVRVFREVRRVTRADGVLFLNLGDSYASTNPHHNHNGEGSLTGSNLKNKKLAAPNKFIPLPAGYKAKDLMGIPWRVAFALQADGWYFRSAMPWIKRNCMPESTTDRPTSAIEYIFLMTKSAKYFYDGEAIRVPSSESYQNDARPQGVLRQKVNKRSKYPNEGQFKKQDATGNPTYAGFNERWKGKHSTQDPQSAGVRIGINSKKAREETGSHDGMFGATRNYRNSDPFFESWQGLYSECENPLAFVINPQSRPELHFATFPDLLAATCIKAGTSEYGCCPKCGAPYQRIVECSGGTTGKSWHPHADDGVTGQIGGMPTEGYSRQFKGWQPGCKCGEKERAPCLVLDPFMGSGTVAVVARELNRSSVGCELNPAYVEIIKKRLNAGSQLDTGVVSYRFEKVSGTNSKVR